MIMANPVWCCLQSGPLAVRVITPLIGVITPVKPIYKAIYRGPLTPFITRGTSCRWWFHFFLFPPRKLGKWYLMIILFKWVETHQLDSSFAKVADLSPRHLRKQSHRWYLVHGSKYYILVSRVWRLDSGPNLQPCLLHFFFGPRIVTIALHIGRPMAFPAPVASAAQDLLHVTGGRYVHSWWLGEGRAEIWWCGEVWYCWWFRNPKQPPGMYKTL